MEAWFALSLCFAAVAASSDPCTNYAKITEPRRSEAFIPERTDRLLCDRAMINGWYRFSNGDMPTSCVPTYHCGTNAPIWLNGKLPSAADGIVTRQACINFGQSVNAALYGGTTCCHTSLQVQVKNCGTFNVYHLSRTPACFMAYCAGNMQVCPLGQTNIGHSTCTQLYPKMTHFPHLGKPYIDQNNHVQFPCHIPYPKGEPNVGFDVTWTADGQVITDPRTHKPVVTKLTGDNRDALLDGEKMQGHLGKTVKCNVTSYYTTSPGVESDSLSSNGFWAGIRVSTHSITADEKGNEQEVTLESTVPIPCNDPHKQVCSIAVEMKSSTDPNDISTTSCTYELRYDNASQTYKATVKVVATRDFVKDGDQVHHLEFRPLLTWTNPMFTGYTISPVQIKSKDRNHALCTFSGDPHFRQIDSKGRMDLYEVGDFVMYKSNSRPFEIHIRTWSCGHLNPCACAIVAREGNDVVSIDMCEKRKNQIAAPDLKVLSQSNLQGMTIDRDPSGKNFYLNFKSGARLTVGAHVAAFKNGERDGHLSVSLQVPSDDLGQGTGLCGTFDNNANNDLEGADGKQYTRTLIPKFAHTWLLKPGTSMLDTTPLYNPRYDSSTVHYCKCDNGRADCTKQKGANPQAQNCGKKCINVAKPGTHPRSVDYHQEARVRRTSNEVHIPLRRSFPTPSGMTKNSAVATCTKAIQTSSLFSRCGPQVMSGDSVQHYIDACVEDMMYADGDQFNIVHMNSFDKECQDTLLRNVSNYSVGPNGERIPPADLTIHLCPNQCSLKGICSLGNCVCHSGYTGEDCSVPVGVAPVLSHIRGDGLCDLQDRPCQKAQVIAENLMDGPGLKCRYQNAEIRNGRVQPYGSYIEAPAKFINFLEVECTLPASNAATGDDSIGAFMVSVTANGDQYSTPSPFVVYDGSCQTCDVNGNCHLKAGTCLIDNICRRKGEQNSDNGFCDPQSDQHGWTTNAKLTEINRLTASGSGCECRFNRTRYDCACCRSGGCQCDEGRHHLCTDCAQVDSCSDLPYVIISDNKL